ncbi:hypothetical protein [Rhodococcus globerulus]|uniref:hypothetical protein n=1 Tax=Rhodococcus globerulus TaxID=33008 RepID=UPI000ACC98A9|nr:hypothetical protein [Rhodococcus globerulus]
MARKMNQQEVAEALSEAGVLTFSDVPADLRPSAWKAWEDKVGQTPRTVDELEAAFWVHGHEPSEWHTAAEKRSFDPGLPDPNWRREIADARHHDAYAEWLAENDLTSDNGQALPGWFWSDLEAWEAAQTSPKRASVAR